MIITGTVKYCGTIDNDGTAQKNISILIPADKYDEVIEKAGIDTTKENIPVKPADDGKHFIVKAHSRYPVSIFENAMESDIDIDTIGENSEVEIDVKMVEGKFKGKPYQTFYLKGINIKEYVEKQPYNPFA